MKFPVEVTEASPSLDADLLVEAAMLGAYGTGGAVLSATRRPDAALMEAVPRRVVAETDAASALDLMRAVDAQHRVTRPVGLFLSRYDLLVTPTLAQPPPPHGTLDYDNPDYTARSWLRRIFQYGPFTAAFNRYFSSRLAPDDHGAITRLLSPMSSEVEQPPELSRYR